MHLTSKRSPAASLQVRIFLGWSSSCNLCSKSSIGWEKSRKRCALGLVGIVLTDALISEYMESLCLCDLKINRWCFMWQECIRGCLLHAVNRKLMTLVTANLSQTVLSSWQLKSIRQAAGSSKVYFKSFAGLAGRCKYFRQRGCSPCSS